MGWAEPELFTVAGQSVCQGWLFSCVTAAPQSAHAIVITASVPELGD